MSYLQPDPDATPQPPADLPEPSTRGAAVQELAGLSDRPLAEHPDVYERIHAELRGALAAIDDA